MIDSPTTIPNISREGVAQRRLMADWTRVKSNFAKARGLTQKLRDSIDAFDAKIPQYIGDPNIREEMQERVNLLSCLFDSKGDLISIVTPETFAGKSGLTYERLSHDHKPDMVAKHILAGILTVLQPARF